ncbi:plasmid stability protein [Actinomyces sp. 432]|uniref:FitA-like ribbon-helix-helix domain-containing protein n=1 Tax=Actinomyces sp. 432 TaxID=2057798 RepID=UPI00137440C5|nr:Arc family DNA-binding protein [Actinomyces sp. 432]QHO91827.1 plasmid stability protein [Actinomyces sp. 432]
MADVLVRNLPDGTHRALKALAKSHGRSMEAEIRQILGRAVAANDRPGLGSLLTSIREEVGPVELDMDRDDAPYVPVNLS